MRTGESRYRELGLASASTEELIEAMTRYPELIQRRVVIWADRAVIARARAAQGVEVVVGESRHVDRDLMVRDSLIPPAQHASCGLFHDGLLKVFAGEAADGIDAGKEHDRGEHDLIAGVLAQQAGAAEAGDTPQVPADLRFVVSLVVVGRGARRPSVPDSRDHLPLTPLVCSGPASPTSAARSSPAIISRASS
jgi:hypothetical protein